MKLIFYTRDLIMRAVLIGLVSVIIGAVAFPYNAALIFIVLMAITQQQITEPPVLTINKLPVKETNHWQEDIEFTGMNLTDYQWESL